MPTTPAIGGFTVLVPRNPKYQKTVREVNTACAEQQLPPAFTVIPAAQHENSVFLTAHPTFRFDSFGLALGLRPKISFHVHYMPDDAAHVELGRFLAPLCLSDLPFGYC